MNRHARSIVALLTIGFGVLAVPFLVLTSLYILSGRAVGAGTVAVFVAYAIGLVALVLLWARTTKGSSKANHR